MRGLRLFVLGASGVLAFLAVSLFVEVSPRMEEAQAQQTVQQEEQRFLELINGYRQANGLAPLYLSETLSRASYRHSEDMGAFGFFSHATQASHYYAAGSGHVQRIVQEGYFSGTYSAENIAYGYHSADTVFEAWRLSPGHNVNMLSPNYRAIGIGLAYSSTGVPYWTTNFGGI